MSKPRDYKAEYQRRIAKGLGRGLSRSQARGHPRPTETHINPNMQTLQYDKGLELGLKGMRLGKSLTKSAKSIGVSRERLSHYLAQNSIIAKHKGKWQLKQDDRIREVMIYSQGRVKHIQAKGYEIASLVGRYMAAVAQFLKTNHSSYLDPFKDVIVRDIKGKAYLLETRPNVLYRLDHAGGETFEQVYRIVV